jgi:hypothetical protein
MASTGSSWELERDCPVMAHPMTHATPSPPGDAAALERREPNPVPPAVPGPTGIGKVSIGSRLVLVFLILSLWFIVLFWAGLVDFGGQRWPVKTFRDRDRSLVHLAPVDATVASLTRLSRPPDAAFRSRSRIAAEEFVVYRVRARLQRVSHESDGDIHMVLADPADPSRSIIAEIPHPLFSIGSGFEQVFRTERAKLRDRDHARGQMVEVIGVGFFDYRSHRRHGGAASGFELHPVIGLTLLNGG